MPLVGSAVLVAENESKEDSPLSCYPPRISGQMMPAPCFQSWKLIKTASIWVHLKKYLPPTHSPLTHAKLW